MFDVLFSVNPSYDNYPRTKFLLGLNWPLFRIAAALTNNMNPIDILEQYYDRHSKAFEILLVHGNQVAQKALKAAEKVSHLGPDLDFIEKAAMLHDIGVFLTNAPQLGCNGIHPYIRHGVLGYYLLIEADLRRFALVCERHVGVGISADDVLRFNLPLPERDMLPISIEEQVICYADKFFSKSGNGRLKSQEKNVEQIMRNLQKYGQDKVSRFQKWVGMFEHSTAFLGNRRKHGSLYRG